MSFGLSENRVRLLQMSLLLSVKVAEGHINLAEKQLLYHFVSCTGCLCCCYRATIDRARCPIDSLRGCGEVHGQPKGVRDVTRAS
jgi:hypothetical protein